MKKAVFAPLAGLILGFGAHTALAHALLESASPPVGGTVSIRPRKSASPSPKASSRSSRASRCRDRAALRPVGKASVSPGDNKVLVVKVGKKLAPGAYTVKWHAVSVDTHHTQGDFDFTVKP